MKLARLTRSFFRSPFGTNTCVEHISNCLIAACYVAPILFELIHLPLISRHLKPRVFTRTWHLCNHATNNNNKKEALYTKGSQAKLNAPYSEVSISYLTSTSAKFVPFFKLESRAYLNAAATCDRVPRPRKQKGGKIGAVVKGADGFPRPGFGSLKSIQRRRSFYSFCCPAAFRSALRTLRCTSQYSDRPVFLFYYCFFIVLLALFARAASSRKRSGYIGYDSASAETLFRLGTRPFSFEMALTLF